jgi:hypothetical protein
VEAASAPSSSSSSASSAAPSVCVKRSAAIAELGDIETSDTRLARVETQLDRLISHLSTPRSIASMPSYYAPPQCEDFTARMAAYFQEENCELEEKQRERRRQAAFA